MFLPIVLSITLIFSATLQAQSVFDVNTSVRALGMGGAYSAVVDDEDALFYNPAALAKIDGVIWTILDPRLGAANEQALTKLQNLQDPTQISSTLSQLYGENIWLGGGAKTALAFPYFGFSYYDRLNVNLKIEDPSFPTLNASYINDLGLNLGFAFPIVPGFLYGGMAIKKVDRTGFSTRVSGASLLTPDPTVLFTGNEKVGTGYGLDVGISFSLPTPVLTPTISAVWKDLGNTKFKASSAGGTDPPSDLSDLTIGAALEIDVPLFTITPALEFRKINVTGTQLGKKIHMGLELAMPFIDARAGFYQGYYSLGAGLSLGPIQIDLATYGEELGEYPGQHEDRRYVLQLTAELSIGFGFIRSLTGGSESDKGVGASRRRRKLKRRR